MAQTTPVETSPPPLPAKMTYEEFLEWADEDTRAEWVDGEVVWMSPVSDEHQEIGVFLIAALKVFVQSRKLGVLRYESYQMKTGASLPGREPDVLFISNARLSQLKGTYMSGPADLVIEIVSPESQQRDRVDKFGEYQRGGVGEYWLIDPLRRQAEFYRRGQDDLFHASAPDASGRYECLTIPGVWVQTEWFWRNPPPDVLDVLRDWGLL